MYKQIEYCVIDFATKKAFGNFVTPQAIVNAAKEYYAALPSIPHEMPSVEEVIGLKETDVIVDLSTLHYGMKEKNPLNSIRFYSKQKSESKSASSYFNFIALTRCSYSVQDRRPYRLLDSFASVLCGSFGSDICEATQVRSIECYVLIWLMK